MSQGYYAQRMGGMPKPGVWKQAGWNRGANNFAEDNEIKDNEFYQAENIEITGKASIRMPRRGSREFTSVPGATKFNGWGIYKNPKTGDNYIIAQFNGHVYKITPGGNVTEIDPTKTFDTDAKMRGILLRDWFYFGNATDHMAKTNGSTLVTWDYVTKVTGLTASFSGSATADILYAYTVTATTATGETEMCSEVEVWGSELDSSNKITITFDRKTDSAVTGYNIYKSVSGSTLALLTKVDQTTSGSTISYVDDGVETTSLIHEAPTFNTTGGVVGNIYAKYANTLFIAGNPDEPDTVFYGGTGANWESFNPSDNGGWVKPGRGDGERVSGMIGFEDFLFIFKETSIWKFTFAGDGGPSLTAVIPQYGTSSPDTIWRMEKDVVFLGTDGRYRIIGYEPNQLNVIRVADISNRIQNRLDALDMSDMDSFFGAFYEQKFILCNGEEAYPYDRRYVGFLDRWTNYNYDRFLVWDKGTGKRMLFGVKGSEGKIYQLLVDNTYDDAGDTINTFIRFKRIDAGEDTILKYYYATKIKIKDARGKLTISTYKDGYVLQDSTSVSFDVGGGVGEYMFDEGMFDEGVEVEEVSDSIQILKKWLEFEAYSIYHQIDIAGNSYNHAIIQTMNGWFEIEDIDYERDEIII